MNSLYCSCGIRLRQLFNDVYSCPRCPTIIVKKDHVKMTWRGDAALVLLDEFERHVTAVLLSKREDAETDMDAADHLLVNPPKPMADAITPDPKDMRPCDQCGSSMRAGCGAVCPNCKWMAPCSID